MRLLRWVGTQTASPISLALTPATLTLSGGTLTPSPGTASITLTPATATLSAGTLAASVTGTADAGRFGGAPHSVRDLDRITFDRELARILADDEEVLLLCL